MTKLRCESPDKLVAVARLILEEIKGEKIILFHGPMGAGKTTLIKELCALEGIQGKVSSPTFSLVNEYRTEKGELIYHFDFYRIEDVEEALDLGFDEYVSSGNKNYIEWPERIESILPKEFFLIEIEIENGERIFSLKKHGKAMS